MRTPLIIAFAALTACAQYDLSVTGQFKPTSNGFEFTTIADTAYPKDSEKAEAKRIARLEQYLQDTQTCPKGYKIVSRQEVVRIKPNAISAGIFDIIYTGQCAKR